MQFARDKLAAALLVLAIGGCSGREDNKVAQFGTVLPNEVIAGRWIVENPTNEPMTLGGFEKACGCEAWVRGNPVIPPRGRKELNLKAVAAGAPGPHGVYFNMTTKIGSAPTAVKRYLMKWTVAMLPTFSPEPLTFKQGLPQRSRVQILTGREFELKLVAKPGGLSIRRLGDELEVSYDGTSSPRGRVEFRVGPSQYVSFACESETTAKLALQPWRIAVRPKKAYFVRAIGEYTSLRCPAGVTARRSSTGLQLFVAATCRPGSYSVSFYRGEDVVAMLPVQVLP